MTFTSFVAGYAVQERAEDLDKVLRRATVRSNDDNDEISMNIQFGVPKLEDYQLTGKLLGKYSSFFCSL